MMISMSHLLAKAVTTNAVWWSLCHTSLLKQLRQDAVWWSLCHSCLLKQLRQNTIWWSQCHSCLLKQLLQDAKRWFYVTPADEAFATRRRRMITMSHLFAKAVATKRHMMIPMSLLLAKAVATNAIWWSLCHSCLLKQSRQTQYDDPYVTPAC